MRKIKFGVLLLVLAASTLCICACSKSKSKTTSSKSDVLKSVNFEIDNENTITATYSDDFKESYYNKDELATKVDNELAEYNQKYAADGINTISKDSLELKDKKVTLKLKFATYQAYEAYYTDYISDSRNAKLFIGSYNDALTAGYTISGKFNSTKGKKKITSDAFEKPETLFVIYTNEGKNIKIPGEVIYYNNSVSVEYGIAKTTDKRENYILFRYDK